MGEQPQREKPAGRQVLADRVYDDLLAALVDGRFAAGAPVSIDGVARELGVSPTPVREALARLESTGMVERTALKGYRVAPLLTAEELAQLMDARDVIEPAAAAMACARATDALCAAMQQAIDDLGRAATGPTFAEFRPYWEADERFHRLVAQQAGNQFLLRAYDSLGGQLQRFRFFGGLGVTDAEHAIAEHSAVLDAFLRRDPRAAEATMRSHVLNVKHRAALDSTASSQRGTPSGQEQVKPTA